MRGRRPAMADKEYIERGVASKIIDNYAKAVDESGAVVVKAIKDIVEIICPAADVVEVRHSQWDEDKYPFCNVCPECGLIIDRTCIKRNSGKLNLCPNCGAKMDGGKEQT
jgi:hypothetical protein